MQVAPKDGAWQTGYDEFVLKLVGGAPSTDFGKNMTKVPPPGCLTCGDFIGLVLMLVLLPFIIVMLVAEACLLFVPLCFVASYRPARLQRPLPAVPRDNCFTCFSVVLACISLPAVAIAIAWAICVSTSVLLLTLPIGILRAPCTARSLGKLWQCAGRPGAAATPAWSQTKVAEAARSSFLLWPFNDLVCACIGAIDRQGLLEVTISLSMMVAFAPYMKLLLANPFVFNLTEVFINQWSDPLDADGDGKSTVADRPHVRECLQDNVCSSLLTAENRASVDGWPFAGHHQFPPPDRSSFTVMGFQMISLTVCRGFSWMNLLSHTTHSYLVPGSVPYSETASWCLISVWLQSWNPWYVVSGYVEVNVRTDGGAEHPMWIILDPDSVLGRIVQRCLNVLFAKIGLVFQEHLKQQPAYKAGLQVQL